ncbi:MULTISPECIES: NgoMIV family type II restriction endonuclease [unclassified Corynebacterium]|uniref:NgoMIV family type II restriction endonuclease n=1 Tax=unclassified Corynebacterium TaxID=2624378 RepID=UPI0029CA5B1A|nr:MULTISPECIES: NgoMIV family type II restriction endonuclease [unclassified Corynebacterium]WPF66214.1 NgoMIV family type II restriction endonuclease [Corynebacterium sp. 22KM0430]WPF68705.1 NgoMIV family type II restriction endonuclease [Corynebacterium sp. 21KM1197]
MNTAILTAARQAFHKELTVLGVLSVSHRVVDKKTKRREWVASNADISQASSRALALHIARQLNAPELDKGPGQTAGGQFESAVTHFVQSTFPRMAAIRPGTWTVENVGAKRSTDHIAQYHPYRHLDDLARAIAINRELESVLGNSYVISPDIMILRDSVPDDKINEAENVVDSQSGLLSPLRLANSSSSAHTKHVHAVLSCKWTMRSDRSQHTRSEALNLIRNRKGRAPHIAAVTAEPSLSRIASLALGTGDVDMVYHAFLPELIAAVEEKGTDDAKEMLETLIHGDRLRDIADMIIDLAV